MERERKTYVPTYLPDGRKAYDPSRTERDIWDEWEDFARKERAKYPGARSFEIEIRAREAWRKEEQDKEPWSAWQKRVWHPRMQASQSTPLPVFNEEELRHLVDTWQDANDPVSRQISDKAKEILAHKNKSLRP